MRQANTQARQPDSDCVNADPSHNQTVDQLHITRSNYVANQHMHKSLQLTADDRSVQLSALVGHVVASQLLLSNQTPQNLLAHDQTAH